MSYTGTPEDQLDRGTSNVGAPPGALAQEFGFNQALSAGLVYNAPQFMLNQISQGQLQNQLGFNLANQALGTDELNRNYNNSMAGLGLDYDKLGVQRSNLGISRDDLGIQQAALQRQYPLLAALHQLTGQGFDLQQLGYWQAADVSNRSALSDATGRGAATSVGFNRQLGDIRNQLANQLTGLDLSRQREDYGYNENVAQLGDRGQQLTNEGRRLDNEGQLLDIAGAGTRFAGQGTEGPARHRATTPGS